MKTFMDEEFMLQSPTASSLYHRFAENMPIIDYHCHLSPGTSSKTAVLTAFPRYGWAAETLTAAITATITNGN